MSRKPKPGKSLAEVNPELAKEWHLIKNGDVTPSDVSEHSHTKVWWKCEKGDDHEWEASVANRSKGKGCPICSGQKVVISNSLAILNPKLAKEWHSTKNDNLRANQVSLNSGKKVWWKCPKGDDHEWESTIYNRSLGSGCAICSGYKTVLSNSLATVKPLIAKQWHPTKNAALTPYDVYFGTHKKVWWKCPKGDDHAWEATVESRTGNRERGCPICVGQKTVASNSLATVNPELIKEWHPIKNGELTPHDLTVSSSRKKVWWKCNKGDDHEWEASPATRSTGSGCPYCSARYTSEKNSLVYTHPALLKEWCYELNLGIQPSQFSSGSDKKVWWKCNKGSDHIWKSSIGGRSGRDRGCPICSGKKVVKSNSLVSVNPSLAKEWHPTKNGNLTAEKVTSRSSKKVWWKCLKGNDHEWITSISHRSNGRNCPYCTLTPQSRQELTITFELKQFFEVDPKGLITMVNGKRWTIDIYLKELNLGIEFDGSYWHQAKEEKDKQKTLKLKADGFKIMRIREEPLKAITDIDVISKLPFNAKHVADDILKHILVAYPLDQNKVDLINQYLRKRTIQNEQGLEDYIEEILTEKAERKKK